MDRNLKICFLSFLVIALCVLGGVRYKTHAQAQESDAAVTKRLIGTWRLVSWPERLANGTSRQNPKNVGYLIYTEDGHMCFVGMNASRPKWNSTPTPQDMAAGLVADAFNAYCANIEVHAKEGFVLHHVEVDKSPNWVGRTRKRWFTFDGPNRVALKMDPEENIPPVVESTLIWERILDR